MSNSKRSFVDEFINNQIGPAVTAILGSVEKKYDQKMYNNHKLSHKNLLCPADLYEICRKAAWYIYSNSSIAIAHSDKDQEKMDYTSDAEFERNYNPSDITPFYNAIKAEFTAAMHAILGSKVAEYDEKMQNNPNLELKDVLDPNEYYEICRKVGWYMFDNISIFKNPNAIKTK